MRKRSHVAGFSTRPTSPWRSFPSTFPLVFLPLIRDGRHCGWHGAPRFLSLVRYRGVGWTLLLDLWQSPCWLRSFLLLVFHPALPFFLGLAVLADASTAFTIVSHPHHIQSFYFTAQSALYAASRGLFPNSLLPVPIPANLTFTATPVDQSLSCVLSAVPSLALALTTRKAGAPHLQSLDCPPHLLFICWMLLESPI